MSNTDPNAGLTPGAGEGQEPNGQGQEPVGNANAGSGGGEQVETFDRAYVEQLRREAAGYRTRATQAEEKAERLAKEAAERAEKAEAEAAALQSRFAELTVSQALYLQAVRMGFHDPEDAVRLADKSGLTVEDDKVKGVEDVLKALATAKPHLVKGRATGDAAASGGVPASDMNAAIRQRAGHAAR